MQRSRISDLLDSGHVSAAIDGKRPLPCRGAATVAPRPCGDQLAGWPEAPSLSVAEVPRFIPLHRAQHNTPDGLELGEDKDA